MTALFHKDLLLIVTIRQLYRRSLCRHLVRIFLALSVVAFFYPAHAAPSPEIRIDGGSPELRDNIRQYLSIADESCAAPDWRINSLMLEAEREIQQAAQALGYYQLNFATNLARVGECWQLNILLTPREQAKIAGFTLIIRDDGAQGDIFKELYDKPDIRIGDYLHHGRYENFKNRITTLATSHGYFDGHFDVARVTVNQSDNTANVELIYNTGARYRIGDIHITHNILSKDFLEGFLNIHQGDYYDTDKLLELKSYYNSSNYFSVATASPDLQNRHDNSVDINIQLEERKRFSYSTGAGFSTDTGPRVLLGFENRYVNSAGHSLKADLSASNIKNTAQVAYTIPLSNPSYEFLKVYAGYEKEVTDDTYSNKDTYGASYTNYERNKWLHTYAVNVENEDSILAGKEKYTHLLIPSVTFSRTQTDATPYPLQGWSMLARLSGSPKTLGSYVSYEQLYLRGKYIYEFGGGRFLLRSELGVTKVNDFDELPVSVRFFAGGGTSVRGYDYKSLGPKADAVDNKTGEVKRDEKTGEVIQEVIGGKNVLVNSIEYDYRVRPNWALAAFYDVGNASDDFNFDLKRGAGVGVRWISPIGPVRIDIARALDDGKAWNLHISMGPDL
ncbi:autotransporter assembly complex protein TamA [Cellvibrio sp.]|uniref:autotransporter assembly complex protein TamA n=1 Tax=Cellvibrio sp. TaxID=1965322 RepID=UPI0039648AE8